MVSTIFDDDNFDIVTFHTRQDFNDYPCNISLYLERGDILALRYHIKFYMDTDVKIKRPDTPMQIIIDPTPKDYIPKDKFTKK